MTIKSKLLNWKLKNNREQGELLHMTDKDREVLIDAINKLVDAVSALEHKVYRNQLEIRDLKRKLRMDRFNDSL